MKTYGAGQETCEKHGNLQIDWKCMFCCSVAVYHCFGTHWFCDRCHRNTRGPSHNHTLYDCDGVDCPLGVPHPPAHNDPKKSSFPLGCGICRSERLEELKRNENIIQEVSLTPITYTVKDQHAGRAIAGNFYRRRYDYDARARE